MNLNRNPSRVQLAKAAKNTVITMSTLAVGKVANKLGENETFDGAKQIRSVAHTASALLCIDTSKSAARLQYRMMERKMSRDINFNKAVSRLGSNEKYKFIMNGRKNFNSKNFNASVQEYFSGKGFDLRTIKKSNIKTMIKDPKKFGLDAADAKLLAAFQRNKRGGDGRGRFFRNSFRRFKVISSKLMQHTDYSEGYAVVSRVMNNAKRAVSSIYRTGNMICMINGAVFGNTKLYKRYANFKKEVDAAAVRAIRTTGRKIKGVAKDTAEIAGGIARHAGRGIKKTENFRKLSNSKLGRRFNKTTKKGRNIAKKVGKFSNKISEKFKNLSKKVSESKIVKFLTALKNVFSGAFDLMGTILDFFKMLLAKLKMYIVVGIVLFIPIFVLIAALFNFVECALSMINPSDKYPVWGGENLTPIIFEGSTSDEKWKDAVTYVKDFHYWGTGKGETGGETKRDKYIASVKNNLTAYNSPITGKPCLSGVSIENVKDVYVTESGITSSKFFTNAKDIISVVESRMMLVPKWNYTDFFAEGKGYNHFAQALHDETHEFQHTTTMHSCEGTICSSNIYYVLYSCNLNTYYSDGVMFIDGDSKQSGRQTDMKRTANGCTKKHSGSYISTTFQTGIECKDPVITNSNATYNWPISFTYIDVSPGNYVEFKYDRAAQKIVYNYSNPNASSSKDVLYLNRSADGTWTYYVTLDLGNYGISTSQTYTATSDTMLTEKWGGVCVNVQITIDVKSGNNLIGSELFNNIKNGSIINFLLVSNGGNWNQFKIVTYTCNEYYCPGFHKATYCVGHANLYLYTVITSLEDSDGYDFLSAASKVENANNYENNGKPVNWFDSYSKRLVFAKFRTDWADFYGIDFLYPTVDELENNKKLTEEEKTQYYLKCKNVLKEYYKNNPTTQSGNNIDNSHRMKVINWALSSVGGIPYEMGGKASYTGYNADNKFGYFKEFKADINNPNQIERICYGLDCSGWVSWVYMSALEDEDFKFPNATNVKHALGFGTELLSLAKTNDYNNNAKKLVPGDILIFNTPGSPDACHVGIYLYTNDDGSLVYVHENAGADNVSVSVSSANYWIDNNSKSSTSSAFISFLQ